VNVDRNLENYYSFNIRTTEFLTQTERLDLKPIQRLYIFDRKELLTITSFILMVALFTFTLGVHLGKRVGVRTWVSKSQEKSPVDTVADALPTELEFKQEGKKAPLAIDETLAEELHAAPRQIHLPSQPKSANAGATSSLLARKPDAAKKARSLASESEAEIGANEGGGKFALQIGSFLRENEARKHAIAMEKLSLKPFLKETEVKGKGKRYRLYLGEYPSRLSAETAGKNFKHNHKIRNFVIVSLH
jgi:cell division septation protein DedD